MRPCAALPSPPRGWGKHCACAGAATRTGFAPQSSFRGKRKGRGGEGVELDGWEQEVGRGGVRLRPRPASRARGWGCAAYSLNHPAPPSHPCAHAQLVSPCSQSPQLQQRGAVQLPFYLLAHTLRELENFVSSSSLFLSSV